jgi:lysophospholipase L1-like esterase
LEAISRASADESLEFQGLDTYRRNMKNLINVCKGNNFFPILSTYCQYLYPEAKENALYLKYYDGVCQENEVIRELANEFNLPLVDNAKLVPQEEDYFVDTVHFTPEGMRLIAENLSRPIIERIEILSR